MPITLTRIESWRRICLVVTACSIAACAATPPIPAAASAPGGDANRPLMPIDLAGSWERDYSRDDDVNTTLRRAYDLLAKTINDQNRYGGPSRTGMSARQASALVALARLGELITRPDVLTISQTEHEISVARKNDFSMLCAFYASGPKNTESPYGRESCVWQGNDLVSELLLPEGLRIVHRFTRSKDGQRLRVTTTLSSPTSRVPFTLRRFYRKFDRLPPKYNCVETLSMKRVCSTGELEL